MQINQTHYLVGLNYPTIVELKIPNVILAGYFVYPHIDILNGAIDSSRFVWFRRNQNQTAGDDDWQTISHNFLYAVKEQDIGCELKVTCEPSNGLKVGLSKEAVSTKPIVKGPADCPFESRQVFTQPILEPNQFRVVSYNLLADIYADSDYSRDSLFPYCDAKYLDFDYR